MADTITWALEYVNRDGERRRKEFPTEHQREMFVLRGQNSGAVRQTLAFADPSEVDTQDSVKAALSALVDAGRIRTFGISSAGRFYIRDSKGERLPALTLTRAAEYARGLA